MNTTEVYSVNSSITSVLKLSNVTLQELNDQYARPQIGGMVFVGLMMIIGVIGNAHVLYLYAFKFPKSNHRIYILWLALLDMITCSVGMPFVLVDLRNPLMFDHVWACKILRFVNYFNSCGSALLLVVIAIDRFKKICRPFKPQMTVRKAKIAGAIVMAIAAFLAWPAPVLYGRSTVKTKYPEITGVKCFTEDKFKNTKYQAYYNEVLILVIFICVIILVTLYSFIGRKIWKQSKFRSRPKFSDSTKKSKVVIDSPTNANSADSTNTQSSGLSSDSSSQQKQIEKKDGSSTITTTDSNAPAVDITNKKTKKKDTDARTSQTKRTTLMLFIITVVYMVAFFPHLSLKITVFLKKGFLQSLSPVGLFLYHTFVWTFFINNMANPIIYGFCDPRFRKEIKSMYRKCFVKHYKAEVIV